MQVPGTGEVKIIDFTHSLWHGQPQQKSPLCPLTALLILLFVAGSPAHSADLKFGKDVHPILNHYCFQCHGEATQMGDLDLRTRQSMLQGGSLIYQRILDGSMPLGDARVSDAETSILHDWIQAGALVETGQETHVEVGKMAQHWAFRPPQRPAPNRGSTIRPGWARRQTSPPCSAEST